MDAFQQGMLLGMIIGGTAGFLLAGILIFTDKDQGDYDGYGKKSRGEDRRNG